MKRTAALFVCSIFILLIFCTHHAYGSDSNTGTLESEAIKASGIETYYANCDGSSFFMRYNLLVQVQDYVRVVTYAETLTEVDRLNGFQWKGTVGLVTDKRILRAYSSEHDTWEDWVKEDSSESTVMNIRIQKRNGTWTVLSNMVYDTPKTPITCPDIPMLKRRSTHRL